MPLSVRRILILCEDEKSSRDYLAKFPYDPKQVVIECVGTGMNTDSLMEQAIERAQAARRDGAPYESIWVVFDRDSFPLRNFNRTFDLARRHAEIVPCWSNECFELWYLLHFCYRDTGIGRNEIWKEVSLCLGEKYEKFDDAIFKKLSGKIDTALKNAGRLAYENGGGKDACRNPSTRVHELVKMLRDLDPATQQEETS